MAFSFLAYDTGWTGQHVILWDTWTLCICSTWVPAPCVTLNLMKILHVNSIKWLSWINRQEQFFFFFFFAWTGYITTAESCLCELSSWLSLVLKPRVAQEQLLSVGLWQEAGARAELAWQSVLTLSSAGALNITMWEILLLPKSDPHNVHMYCSSWSDCWPA